MSDEDTTGQSGGAEHVLESQERIEVHLKENDAASVGPVDSCGDAAAELGAETG
jgi:hypothetical protein